MKNWLQSGQIKPDFIRLDDYSENTVFLLNSTLTSSINTIQSLWSMYEQGQLAIFGYMDREYIFTASSTLVLLNATFGLHEQINSYLKKGLTVLTKMRDQGNNPAKLRRKQLLRLMKDLNLREQMNELIDEFEDDEKTTQKINSPSRYNVSLTKKDEYVVTSDVDKTESIDNKRQEIQLQPSIVQNTNFFTSEKASPLPLHFVYNSPSQGNQVESSNDYEAIINDNKNKLLTTGKEFEDLDKILEILDNNLADNQLWKDMQEQSPWSL